MTRRQHQVDRVGLTEQWTEPATLHHLMVDRQGVQINRAIDQKPELRVSKNLHTVDGFNTALELKSCLDDGLGFSPVTLRAEEIHHGPG